MQMPNRWKFANFSFEWQNHKQAGCQLFSIFHFEYLICNPCLFVYEELVMGLRVYWQLAITFYCSVIDIVANFLSARIFMKLGVSSYCRWVMGVCVTLSGSGTFCGVFRRQALDRGAALIGCNKIVTGYSLTYLLTYEIDKFNFWMEVKHLRWLLMSYASMIIFTINNALLSSGRRPAWGRGTPFRPFLPCLFPSLYFGLFYFFPFSFSYLFNLFSSFIHPFPFYQNTRTPFPGRSFWEVTELGFSLLHSFCVICIADA